MDGGFFLCPDAWEFLLPAEICHLRNAMAVCRKRWDLLTLTPMGCALLPEPAAVTAGILLLPGDCPRSNFRAGTVVTYGLSPRDSITLSSLREPVLCVQRTLPLLCGGVLEPQEFPLPGVEGAERLLPVWGPGCCGPARPILCEKQGVYREFLAAACKIHTKTAMAASCVSVNRRARPRAS